MWETNECPQKSSEEAASKTIQITGRNSEHVINSFDRSLRHTCALQVLEDSTFLADLDMYFGAVTLAENIENMNGMILK
jgi:hypothetical protein